MSHRGASTNEPSRLTTDDESVIRQTIADNVKLALAGDWESFSNLYTPDTVLMPPNSPFTVGRGSIPQMFAAVKITEFSSRLLHVDGSGDVAYGWGEHSWTMRVEGASDPIADKGKWLGIWRKQHDGRWLIAVDMWNSNATPGG